MDQELWGNIKTTIKSFKENSYRCGCNFHVHLNEQQVLIKIGRICKEENYSLISYVFKGNNISKGRITLKNNCTGNIWSTKVHPFLYYSKGRDPELILSKQIHTYITVVEDNKLPIALKCGVAIDCFRRNTEQQRSTIYKLSKPLSWKFPDYKSCTDAEKQIKQTFQRGILSKQEFSDGFSETFNIIDMDAIIKIYEDFGGIPQ